MANKYVWSGATGGGTGVDWANAYTTLSAAITGSAVGDDLWVAHDHSETTATALTLTFPGTATSPNRVICVNRAGSVPPVSADLATTASIATTGASTLTVVGVAYFYGLTLSAGDAANTANVSLCNTGSTWQKWEKCSFVLANTSTSSRLFLASGSSFNELVDCTLTINNASQGIHQNGNNFLWRDGTSTLIQGATLPTTLMATGTANVCVQTFSGIDFSNLSGKTIATSATPLIRLKNCKLPASITICTTMPMYAMGVEVIGCNSAGNPSRNERYGGGGILTTETTIKRTAGASDSVNAYSWKVVTGTQPKRAMPFETFEGWLWNDTTGSSKTLTFHCVTNNVTLQDSEIWVEVEYLSSSGSPIATLVSSAPATQLTAGANLTSDSGEAWTTTGLTTPVKQKFSVSFTPQMAGPIRWKVKVAKASTTVYVDTKPDLT